MILLHVWHYLLVTHGKHTTKINPGLGIKWTHLPNLHFITWPKNQHRSRGVQNVWHNNLKNKTYHATLSSTVS